MLYIIGVACIATALYLLEGFPAALLVIGFACVIAYVVVGGLE